MKISPRVTEDFGVEADTNVVTITVALKGVLKIVIDRVGRIEDLFMQINGRTLDIDAESRTKSGKFSFDRLQEGTGSDSDDVLISLVTKVHNPPPSKPLNDIEIKKIVEKMQVDMHSLGYRIADPPQQIEMQ